MNNHLIGIAILVFGVFLFAVFDATSKYLTQFFTVQFLVWARFLVNLFLLLLIITPRMGCEMVATKRPLLMTIRCVLLSGCTLFLVLAFRTLPLAEASALFFLGPLIVVMFAGPVLGEKADRIHWVSALGGFAGMMFIVRPNGEIAGIGVIFALCAALCNGFYQILTRKLSSTEPPMRQFFYTALIGTLFMSCMVIPYWPKHIPSFSQTLLILSLGVSCGGAHLLLIRAFHVTPASSLAPFLYTQLVWSMLLGLLVFGQFPDRLATLGVMIIVGSGLAVVMRRSGRRSADR